MSGPKKKSWTFVPDRSRVPPNRRPSRRQTTVRTFTYVQDWDPRLTPSSGLSNASQNQSTSKAGSRQPGGTSSESALRESPLAQLIRSSPGPIIIARKVPGSRDKSFRSPPVLSPSSSISSQASARSNQRASKRKTTRGERTRASPGKDVQARSVNSSGEDGAVSASPPSQSRERHSSGSTTRSPATFVASQPASPRKKAQAPRVDSSREDGAVSTLPPSQSRERHSSGSTTRSPARVIASQTASTPKGSDGIAEPLSQSRDIAENSDVSEISRVPLLEEVSPDTEHGSVSEQTMPSRLSAAKGEQWGRDSPRTPADTLTSASLRSESSASARSSAKRSRKKSSMLTFRKKSAQKRMDRSSVKDKVDSADDGVESMSAGGDSSRRGASQGSSGSSQRRAESSTKKRGSNLTFRKKSKIRRSLEQDISDPERRGAEKGPSPGGDIRRWARPSTSTSGGYQSDTVSSSQRQVGRKKSSNVRGLGTSSVKSQRSRQKRTTSTRKSSLPSAGSPAESVRPRDTPRTPANKSMSLLVVTPRSGHVERTQARTQTQQKRSGPTKTKGTAAAARKRTVPSVSSESDGEPTDKRAKVRLWMTGARPRLVADTTDFDILLNSLEDTATEFREALTSPSHKRAVSKFLDEARTELTSMISLQQEFKLQTAVVSRTNSSIRKYRQQLLNLQRNVTSLDSKIAAAKKNREKAAETRPESQESIGSFLSDLQGLHASYSSKYPTDLKKPNYNAPTNAEGAVASLKSSLEAVSTLTILNNRLQEWLDVH